MEIRSFCRAIYSFILLVAFGQISYAQTSKPSIPASFESYFTLVMKLDNNETNYDIVNGLVAYDGRQEIFAVRIEDTPVGYKTIDNYKTNEKIIIQDRDCDATKLVEEFSPFPFPHQNKAGSENLLLFDGTQAPIQQTNENSTWTANRTFSFEDNEGDFKCTTTHFFDQRDVKQKYAILKKMTIVCGMDYVVTIEFLHFRDSTKVTGQEFLQQPPGVYCKGKTDGIPFPPMPERFRLTIETTIPTETRVAISSSEVWYDELSKIIMRDEKTDMVHSHRITIYEYVRGVKYFVNVPLRKCSMENISSHEETMMPVEKVLGIEGSFKEAQYVGERQSDGVSYKVWSLAKDSNEAVTDVSFVQLQQETKQHISVPSKIEKYVYSETKVLQSLHSRIYHYELFPTDWSVFDTTFCFDEDDQGVRFRLTIEELDTLPFEGSLVESFGEAIHLELINTLRVTATRISNFQVHHIPVDDVKALVYGVITESPASYGFGKWLDEGSAEDTFKKLASSVLKKEFYFEMQPTSNKEKIIKFSGTRVERLSRRIKVNTKLEEPELPKSFQTEFTLYFMDNIFHGTLFYDDAQKTQAIHFRSDSEKSFYIYNFTSGEELIINGYKCSIAQIDSDTVSIFPFGSKSLHHKSIGGSKSILLFDGEDKGFVDKEINSFQQKFQKWGSNKNITIDGQQFLCSLTHWFREDDDETTNLEVIDVQCMFPNTMERAIDFSFHFSQFNNTVKNTEDLQQPPGVYCKGRTEGIPFPPMPERFRLTIETMAQIGRGTGATIASEEVWYDEVSKIIMQNKKTDLVHNHQITIYEYGRGVKYFVNVPLRKCSMENISSHEETMMSVEKVLGIKGSFKEAEYVGERKSDGVFYNVWAIAMDSKEAVTDVSFVQLQPGPKQHIGVLSKIENYIYSKNKELESLHSRIYHYELFPTDWSVFDTTFCFDEDDQGVRFRLTIEGSDTLPYERSMVEAFEKAIHLELLGTLQVTETRISNFQVHHIPVDDVKALVYGVITESPASYGFGKWLNEGSADDTFKKLATSVSQKEFYFEIQTTSNKEKILKFNGIRVERLSRRIKVNTKLEEPELPKSFQTEFTLYFMDNIFHGTLFYDDAQKTQAIHYRSDSEKSFYIYNFTFGEELIINGYKCSTERIDSDTVSIFPFGSKSLHHKSIGGSKSILLFDGEDKGFVNEEINSFQQKFQKWGSNKNITIDGQQFLCSLTHWFREDDDETTNLEVIDVQCMFPNTMERAIDFSFHFSQFNDAVKNMEDLQQPLGIYCSKKTSTRPLPQLPNRFRFGGYMFQGFGETGKTSSYSFEKWYDEKLQLIRAEEKISVQNLHTVTVTDYATGVRYYMNIVDESCKIQTLKGNQKTILSKEETLGINKDYTLTQYIGQRMLEGIMHHVWTVSSQDFKNVLDILYIEVPLSESLELAVPVKLDNYDYNLKTHQPTRIFNYELNPYDWSVLDLTRCFDASQRITFQLTIKGSETTSATLMPNFTEAIHSKLIEVLKVGAIRVSNFQVFRKENDLMISGVLTDNPPVNISGTEKISSASAEEAFKNLNDTVRKNGFSFELQPKDGNKIIYTVKELKQLMADDKSVTTVPESQATGYSPGSMGALGICMLALGGVLGAAFLVFYIKYKQKHGATGLTSAIDSDL